LKGISYAFLTEVAKYRDFSRKSVIKQKNAKKHIAL